MKYFSNQRNVILWLNIIARIFIQVLLFKLKKEN